MNIKEVKDLINELLQSDITEFELEHTGTKVKLRRGSVHESSSPPDYSQPHPPVVAPPKTSTQATVLSVSSSESAEEEGQHFVTSPIVGTFYRASSPGAEPFAKVGQLIEEGSVLCIVEAMKLMNEIPSDVTGEVTHIYVDNGHPVEFGQKLFAIRPRK